MRVPRVTQEFFPVASGPANQALALARELARLGIASPILTTTPGDDARVADVTVHRCAPLFALPNFRPSLGVQRRVLREQASVLHVHGWRNPASDGAIAAAAWRGIPLVVQAHGVAYGYTFSREPLAVRAARRVYEVAARANVLRRADVVVASTQQEADELRRYGFDRARVAVIPIGVDARFFVERPHRGEGDIMILTVGRLGARRNIEQTIRALALLRAWGVAARLRVVGPEVALAAGDAAGYRARLAALAAACGVADAVQLVGARQGAALVAEYAAADIFVSTSRYENFGQPLAEAAAAGLPLVATPTGIAPELVAGGAGFLAPCDDIAATADALRRLCMSAELRWQIGQATQRCARQMFDWAQIVPRYVALYERMIQEEPRTKNREPRTKNQEVTANQ